jgi:hypothetical protein
MRDFIFFMCGMVFQTMLFAGGFADNYALLALAFIFFLLHDVLAI